MKRMIEEIIMIITRKWEFNSRVFKTLNLHTLRIIKKCALINYFMKKTLKMLKLIVIYRLRNSRKDISRSILSNVMNWSQIADELFQFETILIEELNVLNVLNEKSFFLKKKTTSTFSNLNAKRSSIMIQILINTLKDLIKQNIAKSLTTLDFTSKKLFDSRSHSDDSLNNSNNSSQQFFDSQQYFDSQKFFDFQSFFNFQSFFDFQQ